MTDAAATTSAPGRNWGRWLLLLLIAAAATAFFALGGHEKLQLDYLQERRDALNAWVEEHFVVAVLLYFALYVLVAALSLPGATLMTLVGGFLFGRGLATLLVSFASTGGATLAFLSTRYLLRDWMQRRFGRWLEPIDRGVRTDGAFYLLTLRLVPVFPFFVVNAVMGLTTLPVWTYWWVSQLGMLPATFLYVNAGTELGQISSLKDVVSWTVLGSLALLGIVPLVLRKGLQWAGRRRSQEAEQA